MFNIKSIHRKFIKSAILSLSLLGMTFIANSAPLGAEFFSKADQFFATYVKNNGVDYAKAKGDPGLANLIQEIETMDLSGASDLERKAFYINAYNLTVILSLIHI